MRYQYLFISSVVASVLLPAMVIAIDPTTSGRILDSFKKEERAILFENMPFDQTGVNDIYQKEYILSGIEGLKNRIASTTRAYEEKKKEISMKRMNLEDAIANIETAIANTAADISDIESDIKDKNTVIDEYQDLSIQLSVRIKKNRSIILSYLANIYSESNLIYNKENQLDIIQSLVLSDSDTDIVSRDMTYKSLVSILGQQFIDDYRSLIKEYYRIQTRMQEEVELLQADQDRLDHQKSNLMTQRDYRERLLVATQGQEELYQKYIESQLKLQEQVESSWKDATQSYTASLEKLLEQNGCQKPNKTGKDIETCANILSFYRNEKALKGVAISTGTTNVMIWPVKPNRGLTAFYKDPEYYRAVGSQHEAIDIPTDQSTDVHAALGGYVYYILPPVPGGYSYMAIKHPNGYFTVYGHLSEILVKPYQFVEQGTVIARSGGAPGTAGAGPMTTGAHLHFEVFHGRESIDPLRVLDITELKYEELPSRYQDKFISDIIEKSGTGADISQYERKFIIKGNTIEERQKYLLHTYATPDFQNWDMWIDTALDAHIDPSFLMCVGLAETTLGNHLKTRYNIGNVGNTDSGDVAYFDSPQEGIQWMVATFNNKYLSRYNTVNQLSRWGNSDGAIYASSNANWHNNIIRCISSLNGRFVEDNYAFRLKNE